MSSQDKASEISLFGEADPLVGSVIISRFEVLEFLGEGSLSTVYRVRDRKGGRTLIFKRIHKRLLENIRNFKKFEQKVKQLCTVQGKNLLAYKDCLSGDDGAFYLVLDDLNFESLEDLLSKSGHISFERSVAIFRQVCSALIQLGEASQQHRDLKPSNILIMSSGGFADEVKLVDFGIVRLMSEESDSGRSSQYITHNRQDFGSPLYLSPEQCTGKRLDSRTDIYSLGCVMYESVTGKPPFVGKNILETAYKHMNEAPKVLEVEDADEVVLTRVQTAVFKCLEKEPEGRYQTAAELLADLDMIFVVSDEEWESTARAFKESAGRGRGRFLFFPMSGEFAIFGFLTAILIGIPIFWVSSSLSSPAKKYPPFNDNALWVITNKKGVKPDNEGFGPRKEAAQDALEMVREDQGEDSEEYANALSNLVELYANSAHWHDAEKVTRELINVSKTVKSPRPVCDLQRILGYCCFMQDEEDDAEKACQEAVSLMEHDPMYEQHVIQPLRVLGDIYARRGDLDKGVATYEKLFGVVDIIKETDPPTFWDTCSKLADMYRRQGKYADAEKYYKLGLEWWRGHGKPEGAYAVKSLYGLGLVLEKESKYEEAGRCFKEALPICRGVSGDHTALLGSIKKHYLDVLWRTNALEAIKVQMSENDKGTY